MGGAGGDGGVVVRVEDAGPGAVVRVVVSGVGDPGRLGAAADAVAAPELRGDRLRATTAPDALVRAAGRALAPEEAEALEGGLRRAV
ncbi:MAG: hypothetical protein KY434_05680, partial [Actinobacteria bacterium]|nr:hypothetical protein [Actinomycetota bacterium]